MIIKKNLINVVKLLNNRIKKKLILEIINYHLIIIKIDLSIKKAFI